MCSHQLCSDWPKSSKLPIVPLSFNVTCPKFLLNKTTKQKCHIPFPQYPGWASATVLVRSSLFIRKPSERAAPNVTSLGKGARKMLRTLGWVTWGWKCKLPKGYTETQNDQIDDYITSSLKHAMETRASVDTFLTAKGWGREFSCRCPISRHQLGRRPLYCRVSKCL